MQFICMGVRGDYYGAVSEQYNVHLELIAIFFKYYNGTILDKQIR